MALHGTGGSEHDLIPVVRQISPSAAIISPRGRVLENGMPRFFKRLAEGVFDEADVRHNAHDLEADAGHELTAADVEAARAWLAKGPWRACESAALHQKDAA